MGKSQPQAPDPAQTAAAQGQWNTTTAQQQQAMNMVGQNTPWGSLQYNQTGSTSITDPNGNQINVPQFTANTTLSPSQQAIFDKSQSAQSNLAGLAEQQSGMLKDYLGKPFEFDNQDAADWSFDLASSRVLPQQQKAREALERQLINRGLRPGTDAYTSEMTRMDQANNDQLNQLALQGRSQAFQEAAYTRTSPINEVTSLLSGSQVTQPGQTFASTPQTQVGGVDYSGLVNTNYNQQLQQHNAQMGGLFGLGGNLAQAGMRYGPALIGMMSDRRAKENIRRVGETDGGIPIYTYRYKGSPVTHMGVMADEVDDDMKVMGDDGLFRVYYDRVH